MKTLKDLKDVIFAPKKLPTLFASIGNRDDATSPVKKLPTLFASISKRKNISEDKNGEEHSDLHDRLVAHHKNYDEHDLTAIKNYTDDSYNLNRYLHRKHNDETTQDRYPEHELHAKMMDKAVTTHKAPEDFHVYSGLRKSPEHNLPKDGNVHLPAYTSTSLSKSTARQFARGDADSKHANNTVASTSFPPKHILHIHIPEGHHGAYVDHHSENQGEEEYILPRDTKLHIHHTPEYDKKHHSMIWHAHPIN
jgi:hypothetical protein